MSSVSTSSKLSTGRTIVYQSPRIPPRRCPPEIKNDNPIMNSDQVSLITADADGDTRCKDSVCLVNKPSKIPTPLPRKSINVKITSGTLSSSSTPPSSPAKVISQPKLCLKTPSKIPSPLKCQQDETNQVDINQDKNAERRRTVVEICERIVVPQGETPPLPVTPFIMVNEVRSNDQQFNALR